MLKIFEFINKIFAVLLTNLVNVSNHTKYVSLSNKKFKIQPTFINLHVNEYKARNYTTIYLRLN